MFDFGSRLKELRKSKEITQKQLAIAIGASERGIQNYELNERKPTFDILINLAEYFDVTIDFLVGRSDLPDYSASEDTIPFPYLPIRLKELREAREMDIFGVAELIGETPRNYAGYEEGEVLPRLRVICTLADLFDVSLDYLIGRSDNPTCH